MLRVLACSALVPFLFADPVLAELYHLTISASPTDPFVNSGPVAGASRDLYLWLVCEPSGNGAYSVELALEVPSGSSNLGFTTMNGVLNVGDNVNLLLAVPCTVGPMVFGAWQVLDVASGNYCLVTNTDTGGIGLYGDCGCLSCFDRYPLVQRGYSAGGTAADCPMTEGFVCGPTETGATGWGRLKALHR